MINQIYYEKLNNFNARNRSLQRDSKYVVSVYKMKLFSSPF